MFSEIMIMLVEIENSVVLLLEDIVRGHFGKFLVINENVWTNYQITQNNTLGLNSSSKNLLRSVTYNATRSKHNFTLILYVLAFAHKAILQGTTSNFRELFYKNKELICNQQRINIAIRFVCSSILHIPSWNIGLIASGKGLVAGALRMRMKNGDLIDCQSHKGATLLPTNLPMIDSLQTNAKFILLLEKDTIFQKLLSNNIFEILGNDIILLTGRGYPDMTTRQILYRLHNECFLPIYIIVDADPCGLEIMLIYKYGSKSMAHCVDQLACPQIRWLGIHPSEIEMFNIAGISFGKQDTKKVLDLLIRPYINYSILGELQTMLYLKKKASIENISFKFFLTDYLPNKLKRNLTI